MRVALIGSGIVAGFAAFALRQAGVDVDVLSIEGRPTPPPPGAFYLHDLPTDLRAMHPPRIQVETIIGGDLSSYTKRMWGKHCIPTSIDRLWAEVRAKDGTPRTLVVADATQGLMESMFAGVRWLPGPPVTKRMVGELLTSPEYAGVVQTVNIPWDVTGRSDVVSMPVVKVSAEELSLVKDPYWESILRLMGVHTAVGELREASKRYHCGYITLYNAQAHAHWLRATLYEDDAFIELIPAVNTSGYWDDVLAQKHAWSVEGRESCLEMVKENAKFVPKIHPNGTSRNRSPSDRLLLTGRWATYDRRELSHHTYTRTAAWVRKLQEIHQDA